MCPAWADKKSGWKYAEFPAEQGIAFGAHFADVCCTSRDAETSAVQSLASSPAERISRALIKADVSGAL